MTTGNAPKSRVAGLRTAGTPAEALEAIRGAQKPATRKYRNVPTEVDGRMFDSKREATRYANLLIEEQLGNISGLDCQVRFPLVVHGIDCGAYVADFTYLTRDGERVVEDVKSAATRKLPTYRLKRKLVWALYGLTIREVGA